jgi:hypothetical protein
MRKLFNFLFSFLLLLFVSTLNAQLVFEYEGTRNLSSSPITIDVQGDKFDYHFIAFCDSGSTTTGHLDITLNSDTGSNYSRFSMYGAASSAAALNLTSQTAMRIGSFTNTQSSRNALLKGSLTGSSGDNRKISSLASKGYSPQIDVADYYWTNTVDPVDEITFTGSVSASYKWHIIVYRTGKITSQSSWQIVDTLSWSSESTEKSFTGLDGDLHKQYMVSWEGDQNLLTELNNVSTGTQYTRQLLYNNGGSILAVNTNNNSMQMQHQGSLIINAESGVNRLIHASSSRTTASQQLQTAYWFTNTVDNLVSIDCTPAASATGTATLYRRKNPHTTADKLPFTTLKTFTVSGDYSSGDTLSGLSLDQYKLVKIEWLGHNTSGSSQINVQLNSDTGSNYTRQQVYGQNSTTGASSSTLAHFRLANPQNGDMSRGVIYIYPKSGEYRPVLKRGMYNENTIVFTGAWWLDSASEITSIKTFANNTNSMTGKIKISVLK